MKKRISLFLVLPLLLTNCSQQQKEEKKEDPGYTLDQYDFETIYQDGKETALEANPTDIKEKKGHIYPLNLSSQNKNYLQIRYESDVDVLAYLTYHNVNHSEEKNTEKLFLPKGETNYQGFLDAFRKGAKGKFDKVLDSLRVENTSEEQGTFVLVSLGLSSRTYDPKQTLYLEDDTMKFGSSLRMGGAITYVERLDADVIEYLDSNEDVIIDRDIDIYADYVNKVVSEHVNLVNDYDLGREIQQSFYWDVDESNGYTLPENPVYPGDVHYNPIQCGTPKYNEPQIVDYTYSKDKIYVKSYGMDWFLGNTVDATYFETTFSLYQGTLISQVSVTNFTGFSHLVHKALVGQETPAYYSVHPLKNFYVETSDGIIKDNALSKEPGSNYKNGRNQSVPSPYSYYLPGKKVEEKWAAFVNDNNFGLGVFNPTASLFKASRGYSSSNLYAKDSSSLAVNLETKEEMYTPKEDGEIPPSCYTYNYNYLNTAIQCKMEDYVPLTYSYALFAGDIEEMKQAFSTVEQKGLVKKEKIAWQTR